MYEEDNFGVDYPDQNLEVPVTITVAWSNDEILNRAVADLIAKEVKEQLRKAVRS